MARGTPRTRRKEARPAEIVEAALAEFAEMGFAAATLEAVARRAGVAKGTIYLYFETKDALFEAVVRAKVLPRLAEAGDLIDRFDGPSDQLLAMVIGKIYHEVIDTELRSIMRLLIAEGARFPNLTAFYDREILARGRDVIRSVILRGVERGEFRPSAATDMPEVVMGPAILAAVWRMIFEAHRPLDLERFLKAHIDLALNGLRAPGAGGARS